ncbi:putative membrane glycoprotein US30 [Cynomolgus macaque cytomegalovirus strain Ottawa]|uniref:Membrane glycoprotein US30 n=1 Tax=macacine betaherpesvirus 8 TaxID=2560567 RepID=G8H0Z5_9BETA|nr:putative membrane glycoprotein US30 [Cynomolgus macaque cytomegalovirus strain Ottawa]AEQ32343.1 putative membrane glycoprotein US30 [Cynomolgus macaque cytomegalovirus strain Ottawa]
MPMPYRRCYFRPLWNAIIIASTIAIAANACHIEVGEDATVEQECRQRNVLLATGQLTPHSHRPHVLEFTFSTKDRLGSVQRLQLHITGLQLNNRTVLDQSVYWRLFSRATTLEGGVKQKAKLRLISEQHVPARHCEITVGRDSGLDETEPWGLLNVLSYFVWWVAMCLLAIDIIINAYQWIHKINSKTRTPVSVRAEILRNEREMFWKRRRARHGGVSESPVSSVPPRYACNEPWSPPSTADATASNQSAAATPASPTPPEYSSSSVFPPFPQ